LLLSLYFLDFKIIKWSQAWWYIPIIPPTWEVENRRIVVLASL
jgi:hypothetical protein